MKSKRRFMHGKRRRRSPLRHEPWAEEHQEQPDHGDTKEDHASIKEKEEEGTNKFVVDTEEEICFCKSQ